jgi:hypothetical protein
MRLLQLDDKGEYSLVEFVGNDIPRYAILSHTWGRDIDEVTFQDLINGRGKDKLGYSKIRFCTEQAARDGLQFSWIDTCSIDKSSSTELSEAINSMFRWYQNAAKCYVYLSDVSAGDSSAFRGCRWFSRGWTLQELVAPTSVEFFSSVGERLGDKNSLVWDIAEITGIPIQALQGQRPLSEFSVNERMAWAKGRQTKREEDGAYCLLGIFDIHMSLIYGEGRTKALARLQNKIEKSLKNKRQSPVPPTGLEGSVREHQLRAAEQRVLDSLQFPKIQERRHQIHEAHRETYRWILQPPTDQNQQWDSFSDWLSSPTESRNIYWIYGKPGSGKSTMMEFLNQNIVIPDNMLPWAQDRTVLSAHHFFWNPGNKLQKSINGFLKTLLMQLLQNQPYLTPEVIPQNQWVAARAPGDDPIDWTNSDLKHALYQYILSIRGHAKVFMALDGLDELDGSDDERQELIDVVISMARLGNVKICLSSRPWNVFRDAFEGFLQLRLEDLTYGDISNYVNAQLHGHSRFQHLVQFDRINAEILVSEITQKAAGVFLWVRLVVRDLLQGLRDGDGPTILRKRLEEIPGDLNDYFKRLMGTISIRHRQEASEILQIALYDELEFVSLHPLRLIDLSFIDEGRPDFALSSQYDYKGLNLTDREKFQFRLDSTMRRLNSRCMGLLECRYHAGEEIELIAHQKHFSSIPKLYTIRSGQVFEPSIYPEIFQGTNPLTAFNFTIDFLHRSCRDFLRTPEIQRLLHQYTHGPYDSRMFLLNSRLAQFVAFDTVATGRLHAIAIASYVLSLLSLPTYKSTPICAVSATVIQPVLEKIIRNHEYLERGFWYIYSSIMSWRDEQSSFLTLAIDFELSAYVTTYLTPESVQKKTGRPILDYILRPRFAMCEDLRIGYCRTSLEIVRAVLRFGADPNAMYGTASVWAHFLCFIADCAIIKGPRVLYAETCAALELLARAGAAPLLPESWLSNYTCYDQYKVVFPTSNGMSPEVLFACRWSDVVPTTRRWDPDLGSFEPYYAVGDLLEQFRPEWGSKIDELKRLLDTQHQEDRDDQLVI